MPVILPDFPLWMTPMSADAEHFDELCRLVEIRLRRVGVVDRRGIRADVDTQNVGTLARQPDRVRSPLPSSHSGDECNLALEISHDVHFSFAG